MVSMRRCVKIKTRTPCDVRVVLIEMLEFNTNSIVILRSSVRLVVIVGIIVAIHHVAPVIVWGTVW